MKVLAILTRWLSRSLGLRRKGRPELDLWAEETTPDLSASHSSAAAPGPRRWLVAASRVGGASVFNPDGRQSGLIHDLSVDKRSGRVIYALVAFGALHAVNADLHPLPWALLHYDLDRDGYVLPFDASAIASAPHLTLEELRWFGVTDEGWRSLLEAYYEPYFMTPFI